MAIEFAIQKWGNSAAIRLPAPLLAQLNLQLGDKLTAKVCAEGLMLVAHKHKYTLDELLAQCDTQTNPPTDMNDWLTTKPTGNEVW